MTNQRETVMNTEAKVNVVRRPQAEIDEEARTHWRGDYDKVATAVVSEMFVYDIRVTSRYGKARELEEMISVLDHISAATLNLLEEMIFDSKSGNCVAIRLCKHVNDAELKLIGIELERWFRWAGKDDWRYLTISDPTGKEVLLGIEVLGSDCAPLTSRFEQMDDH